MNAVFWGGLLRFGEALLAGAPTLLVGLFVAGVFRRLIGAETTRKLFGGATWRSLPQAWIWGMLLPVCSIGVIPVAYELRRAGLKGGTILAFALTAPLFNPLSLLYGLTLSTPVTILAFAGGSLVVVTSVGLLWDWLFPTTEIEQPTEREIAPGLERMAAAGLVAARHMAGPTVIYATIGLAGSILLAAIFPFGSLTDTMGAHRSVGAAQDACRGFASLRDTAECHDASRWHVRSWQLRGGRLCAAFDGYGGPTWGSSCGPGGPMASSVPRFFWRHSFRL